MKDMEAQTLEEKMQSGFVEYSRAISGEPIMAILRVHLLTEYYLERLIQLKLPKDDKLIQSRNFTYRHKLALVEALAVLDDALISSLKNLNSVRNDSAHERDKQLSLSDVELIGNPFGEAFKKVKHERPKTVKATLGYVLGMICACLAGDVANIENEIARGKEGESK